MGVAGWRDFSLTRKLLNLQLGEGDISLQIRRINLQILFFS